MGKAKIKKAILVDPYIDSMGGGERYFLTVANILAKNKYKVDLFWAGDKKYIKQASDTFGIDLTNINIVNKDFYNQNIIQRFNTLKQYDLSFIINDGSIPFLFSKKNFLHVQVPFNLNNQSNLLTRLKLMFINKLICNSYFTKKWTAKTYNTNKIEVLYPPVDTDFFRNKTKKEKQILSVARFSSNLNNKRQDIIIKAFKGFYKLNKDYKLILAGGSQSNNPYLDKLKASCSNLPITFEINPDIKRLKKLYSSSQFFWHAAGFGIDENQTPEKTEHFGIVLVEAISADCLVLVVDKGGAREITSKTPNAFLYNNINKLIKLTSSNINTKTKESNDIKVFSVQNFEKQLLNIINQK